MIDDRLCEAVERAESGLIDANLGGGLIKQRVARLGQGRSGGTARWLPIGGWAAPCSCTGSPRTNATTSA